MCLTVMAMLDVASLQQMLRPDDDSDSDSDCDGPKYTPGDIGTGKSKSKIPDIIPSSSKKLTSGTKDIWDEAEVNEGVVEEAEESRPQPQYDMCYKQNVATEDVFLGMSGKHAGTEDELIVTIELPEVTKQSEIDLNVTDTRIDCWTEKHALRLHLPKPVISSQGSAQWVTDKHKLRLTLPLKQDWDSIKDRF